jgi:hypothetical protein
MSRRDPGADGPVELGNVVRDVLVVLAAFVVAAIVVGVAWPMVVDPVVVERTEDGLLTDEVALGDRFDAVGWYALLSGGAGLLLGAILVSIRRAHEVMTLLAVLVGACAASWLAAGIGTWLGPDDPNQVLADAEIGATAPERVVLTAEVAYLVWPISAVIGSAVVLWSQPGRRDERDDQDDRDDGRT